MSARSSTSQVATVRDALARADELAAAGRCLEAIDVLNAVNRTERDGALESRLVAMRYEAFGEVDRSYGWPWEENEAPRPRTVDGLPPIAREDLTPATLRDSIMRYGCAYVPGLLDADDCATLRARIDEAFDAFDRFTSGTPQDDVAPSWTCFPDHDTVAMASTRHWVRQGGGVLTGDSPPALFTFLEILERAGIRDLVAGYLGERPVLSLGKSTLRKVAPTGPGDWHQDGRFLGTDLKVLNVWLNLSDCGVSSPGLEVVPRRLPGLAPSGTFGTWFDWAVAPDKAAEAAAGVDFISPHYAPGDALLFDELFLHHTYVTPEMHEDRYAVETWMFAPSKYPDDQSPIVW